MVIMTTKDWTLWGKVGNMGLATFLHGPKVASPQKVQPILFSDWRKTQSLSIQVAYVATNFQLQVLVHMATKIGCALDMVQWLKSFAN